jgi:hypothetical protein
MQIQSNEISVEEAIHEAPASAGELATMAAQHRGNHTVTNQCQTIRHWQPGAGTFCYQTHIAITGQTSARFAWLTDVFFGAATFSCQPWYPQFKGGASQALGDTPAEGILRHQLSWGRFDLGLSAPRYYRQLISLAQPGKNTAVIVARSVPDGPRLPAHAKLAYTLPPNGEVLHLEDGCLHWHHICCTPGAALLPAKLDRWFINGLRHMGLDATERKTYREEAERLRNWLHTTDPAADLNTTH